MTLILIQVALPTSSLVTNRSLRLRTSSLLKTSNISSYEKTAPSGFAFNYFKKNNNNIRLHKLPTRFVTSSKIVCQLRKSVAPLALEPSDDGNPPKIRYSIGSPYTTIIRSVDKITSGPPDAPKTYHIVFDHNGLLPHWEGQVFGVRKVSNQVNPHAINFNYFYGASSRYGDHFDGETASLCVPLCEKNPTSVDLCQASSGDMIQLAGPTRTRDAMFLGDYRNPKATHIFVATGSGVAPFRAHLRRFFTEDIPTFKFSGLAWLLHGVATEASRLYKEEFDQYKIEYPNNFKYDYALSRNLREPNRDGGRRYVQDILGDNPAVAANVLKLLREGAYIYFSGYLGMIAPIENALKEAAGGDWDKIKEKLMNENRWREEVY